MNNLTKVNGIVWDLSPRQRDWSDKLEWLGKRKVNSVSLISGFEIRQPDQGKKRCEKSN